MEKNVPIGIDSFRDLANKENNYLFADKSLLIKAIIDDKAKVTLITRPRRWGKTLNMSMLECFFSPELEGESAELFADLAISRTGEAYLEYRGKYPVIFISFKDIRHDSPEAAIEKLRSLVQEAFRKYEECFYKSSILSKFDKQLFEKYLTGQVNNSELQGSILILSELLHKHYREEVYILIDEYDTPLNYAYIHDYCDEMVEFMKNLFGAALKGNRHLKKGVMTGILWVSKNSMLSGLNNVKPYSVLSERYAEHFGFSDDEVQALFKEQGVAYSEGVREYYNGYQVGSLKLYNPWSVMYCLDEGGKLAPYWVNTSDNQIVKNSLLQSATQIKHQLQQLINVDKHVIRTRFSENIRFDDLANDEISLWSLLLAAGYLTLNKPQDITTEVYELTIPNREIKRLFLETFKDWMVNQLGRPKFDEFMMDLVSGRVEAFTEKLETYLMTYASYHDFPTESNYHTFMTGLLCSLTDNYLLLSNPEAGSGRADIVLLPRDAQQAFAIIIELKRDKKLRPSQGLAKKALNQIDVKNYDALITKYRKISKVLKIGLLFNGKKVASSYRWDEL